MNFGGLLAVFLIALALSVDAFVVSVANGICIRGIMPLKNAVLTGAAFGLFQGIMPLIGYSAGHLFHGFAERLSHWAALLLLGAIGLRMIIGALREPNTGTGVSASAKFSGKTLLAQAFATGIDALAVGMSFAFWAVNIYFAALLIACTTFILSFCGVLAGARFRLSLGVHAAIFGGAILILIGVRIFLGGI